jgi:type VI secretion system protein ImpA
VDHVLLQPITADRPCGENLEDTPLLASFDAFRLFGQATTPDARPDPRDPESKKLLPPPAWGEIKTQALEALRKSKDLRLLAYFGTASLRTDGLPAFAETLTVASQWLETYWTETYPPADEDAIARRSALNCFADQMAVIDGLRRLPLVDSRQHGRFGLRDVDIATGQLSAGDSDARPDQARINAAFADIPLEDLKSLQQSVASALAALQSIGAAMSAGAGPDALPDFDPLSLLLVRISGVLSSQLAMRPDAEGAAASHPDSVGGVASAGGVIKSRQDAIRSLEAVAEFFRRNEPSSPIPLFLDRAKRLVSKNFLEVLADVAPEAVPQARAAGGLAQRETQGE